MTALILCLLALLSAQAMAAGTVPGIIPGGGAITKGSTVVMAGTDWDVVRDSTSTDSADGRLLMTAGVKSAGSTGYRDQMSYLDTFYGSSFSDLEKAAVMSTSKTDPEGTFVVGKRMVDSGLNGAKLFALSATEAMSYFGSDDERLPGGWWLRSHDRIHPSAACVVDYEGYVNSSSTNSAGFGVRPAFNLGLSSVLFSSAAEGGKSPAAAMDEIPSNPSGKWKLTLLDPDRVFSAGAAPSDSLTAALGYDAWELHLTYSGALTGSREYVSALLCDSHGQAKYYGHIAAGSASGTATLAMPAGLPFGEYTLRLFSEQCNGDNETDYGSAFADVPLTVTGGETHTVTFDMTGAGADPEPQTVGHGDLAFEPKAQIYDGILVTGWEYLPEGQSQRVPFDFNTPITKDMTIFAVWEQLPHLVVNASGQDWGYFTVVGSDGAVYTACRSVDRYIPNGITLVLKVFPYGNCIVSGSITMGGAQQPTALSSTITSYSLGNGDATVDLTFEQLPVLTMEVTPDGLGPGFWTVTDGRRDSAGNPVNFYEDGSRIPLPTGDTFNAEDDLTLTVTPGSYGFDGSIDNNGEVTRIADGVTSYRITAAGPVTISLEYYDRSAWHTIRFHNGNDVIPSQRVAASENAGEAVTAALNRAAFSSSDIFIGWNTVETPTAGNPGVAYADGAQITLSGDIDLYAQWTDAWAVTFYANGGEGSMDKYRLPKTDATGNLPNGTFTRDGYAFNGWNTKANGRGTPYAVGEQLTLTKNLILYAQWAPAWTVTFDANGGEGNMPALPVAKGRSAALPANTFTREGYAFAGWATSANGEAAYAGGATVAPTADMTLYAVWTPVPYSITYELDGGALPQGVTNPAEYTVESPAIALNIPEKAGFSFGGWYADAQFERQVSGIGRGSTGNRTFYAKWDEIVLPAFGTPDLCLPSSLTTVEEEAFEGIAASVVDVPESCTGIGDRAFRNCPNLTQIRIPADCELGTDVFDGCEIVVVFGTEGSPAEAYCKDPAHGNCVFVPLE